MSVQHLLPSLRTGRTKLCPSAYLHPGEVIRMHGTRFLVKANASITVQYEGNDEWNVLPMSAHLGKVLPEPLAWIADAGRRELVWHPLTRDRTG